MWSCMLVLLLIPACLSEGVMSCCCLTLQARLRWHISGEHI